MLPRAMKWQACEIILAGARKRASRLQSARIEGLAMKFAKVIFWLAGAWGVMVLTPMYFLLDLIARRDPPAVTHPEFYFGFIGVAMVWQFAFFVIGADPIRYRPMMIPAIAEKLVHVASMTALYMRGRINAQQLGFNLPDLFWGVLFVIAFITTRHKTAESHPIAGR
jgi:hypothetical protein